MISGCPPAPCLLHFVLRETQILRLPESRHFWVKEPLVCKENSRGGIEKGAKSWSLSEGTNIRRCQGKLTRHRGQCSPYLYSNRIRFSCLLTTKEKKNQEPLRECFWNSPIFPSAQALCKRGRQWAHFPRSSAPSASLEKGNPHFFVTGIHADF